MVLKFFNGVFIFYGYLLFYCLAKRLSGNRDKALWAYFFLAAIPCYLSHFIWAHALTVSLFPLGFYLFLKTEEDKRFVIPAAVALAGILLSQPTQAFKFAIMLLWLLVVLWSVVKTFPKRFFIAGFLGIALALLWWGPVAYQIKTGSSQILVRAQGMSPEQLTQKTSELTGSFFDPGSGSATRVYTWQDYFFTSTHNNTINNPVGVGSIIILLAFCGLFFIGRRLCNGNEKDRIYAWAVLGWLVFTFLGMNSLTFHLPVGLFAFRFWMLFAIPVSLLATEGCISTIQFSTAPWIKKSIPILLVIAVITTSTYQKWRTNTNAWPWGVYWSSMGEVLSYTWMRQNLPADTRVFTFTNNFLFIGNDMRADYWKEDYQKDFRAAFNLNMDELYKRLSKHKFQYVIIGERDAENFGLKAVNEKIASLFEDPRFELTFFKRRSVRIFRINGD